MCLNATWHKNKPFTDGNKRTAIAAASIFSQQLQPQNIE
jgi:prophage maintenance system killer protein